MAYESVVISSGLEPGARHLRRPPSLLPITAAVWAGFSLLGATQTYVSMLSHGTRICASCFVSR